MARPAATEQPVARIVGANLRALRDWHHLSLRELSHRTRQLGLLITTQVLSEIERSSLPDGTPRSVSVDQLVVLARVFRVPVVELMRPGYQPAVMPVRSASAGGS